MKQLEKYIEEVDDELAKSVYRFLEKGLLRDCIKDLFEKSKSSGRKGDDLFRNGNKRGINKNLYIGRKIQRFLPIRIASWRRARFQMA